MGQHPKFIAEPESRTIVRLCAIYDLLVVGPLAFPGLSELQLNNIFWLNHWLGLAGARPDFEPAEMLFVNLFGIVALMWTYLRLFSYEKRFCSLDLRLRGLVSLLLVFYATTQDVHALVWGFLTVELFFLCAYSFVIKRDQVAAGKGHAG
jgi:hypothetical protein